MVFERVRKLVGKERILTWNPKKNEDGRVKDIVWRFPDPSSENEMERDPTKVDVYQVKIGETAVALINNELHEAVQEGSYSLKGGEKKGLEIIFVNQGQVEGTWGIPGNILTKDKQLIGANGTQIFRVSDPKNFVRSIVSAQRAYNSEQINEFIKRHFSNILREHLANYNALDGEILTKQEELTTAMKAKCQEMFSRWGLELVALEFNPYLPEDKMRVIQESARTRMEEALIKEQELRAPLQEKKAQIEARQRILLSEIDKAEKLKEMDKETELRSKAAKLEELKKDIEIQLKHMDIDSAKLDVESGKISVDVEKTKAEVGIQRDKVKSDFETEDRVRKGQAEAMVREMAAKAEEISRRASIADRILERTTEGDLGLKAEEQRSKAALEMEKTIGDTMVKMTEAGTRVDLEIEKMHTQKEIEVSKTEAEAEVGVAKAKAEAEVAEGERRIRAIKEVASLAAQMAEANAIGGIEGKAMIGGLQEKLYVALAQSGIDVAKLEQAKSMAKTPPSPYVKIEHEVTKESYGTSKCSKCGHKLSKEATYCEACGTKQ